MQLIEDSLNRYRDHRIPPGSFLRAVLCNDLLEACQRADAINRHHIFEIVRLVYNTLPIGAYGSPERYDDWISGKHLEVSE